MSENSPLNEIERALADIDLSQENQRTHQPNDWYALVAVQARIPALRALERELAEARRLSDEWQEAAIAAHEVDDPERVTAPCDLAVFANGLRSRVRALEQERDALLAAVRQHRDRRGDDRCWLDDAELYASLPEGAGASDQRQLPPSEMLANCRRFVARRHPAGAAYASYGSELAEAARSALLNRGRTIVGSPACALLAALEAFDEATKEAK